MPSRSPNMKIGWVVTRAALLGLLCNVFRANADEGATVIDLSVDFETSPDLDNQGAEMIAAAAKAVPDIATAIVVEKGKIVANYVRDDVDPDDTFQIWSCTKSWMSLLIGIAIEDGALSLNDTLGDIFTDESVWTNITDVTFRKNVTIYELLTMSSGLIDPFEPGDAFDFNFTDGGNGGGADLPTSLAWPFIGLKGDYYYLAISTILSYVVQERTGMSPRDFLNVKVLPFLGIDKSAYSWWVNEDGMEFSYHGLEMTALQMAKFGQLYLQKGLITPDGKSLVSKDWVAQSTTPLIDAKLVNVFDPNQVSRARYGYLFWINNGTYYYGLADSPGDDVGDYYCAIGAFGQDICVHTDLERVSVMQRDGQAEFFGNLITTAVAFNKSVSFTASVAKDTSDAANTSWILLSLSTALIICGHLMLH